MATGSLSLDDISKRYHMLEVLMDVDGLDAEAIARRGLEIAAGICIYTNENVVLEKL